MFRGFSVSFRAEAQRPDRRNPRGYPPAEPSGPAPPPGGIGQASDQLAAQALDLLNNGKLPEAAAAYSTLLEKYPNSGAVPEAMFRLGYIQYVQGEYATCGGYAQAHRLAPGIGGDQGGRRMR